MVWQRRYGEAGSGKVRFGRVRQVWHGRAWLDVAGYVSAGEASHGLDR